MRSILRRGVRCGEGLSPRGAGAGADPPCGATARDVRRGGAVLRRDVPGECAEGVLVTLEGEGIRLETRTDNYGDFEFDGLEKNKGYRVNIECDGYASMIIEVFTQTDVDLGGIVLEPFE